MRALVDPLIYLCVHAGKFGRSCCQARGEGLLFPWRCVSVWMDGWARSFKRSCLRLCRYGRCVYICVGGWIFFFFWGGGGRGGCSYVSERLSLCLSAGRWRVRVLAVALDYVGVECNTHTHTRTYTHARTYTPQAGTAGGEGTEEGMAGATETTETEVVTKGSTTTRMGTCAPAVQVGVCRSAPLPLSWTPRSRPAMYSSVSLTLSLCGVQGSRSKRLFHGDNLKT